MREAFIAALTALAAEDPRPVLLTADLGFMVVEPFARAFPLRFINVGVAEQNMIGLATGLAEAGLLPFCYSITPFATLRPFEFIRNGPVGHRLPVRIIGIGSGFDYGSAGSTHYGVEDIAAMRSLVGISVAAPADGPQARAALAATWDAPGPVYYRLSKGSDDLPELDGRFRPGRAERLRAGDEVLLVATGPCVRDALQAADLLVGDGVAAGVLAVPCLAPAPTADLVAALRSAGAVIAVEAHGVVGGLGSLVAETLAEAGLGRPFRRLGIGQRDDGRTGSNRYLVARHGLDAEAIAEAARALLAARP